jgi:hypothetical protein
MNENDKADIEKQEMIVVLGDWFIDENWLVAKHESYSSSNTGKVHYLVQHREIDKRCITLCGAPEILIVLKSYLDKKYFSKYSFIGFGAWNEVDDDIIHCTLCSHHIESKHLTPYTLKSLKCVEGSRKNRICPYNNERCIYFDLDLTNLATKAKNSTNRIIRCYEGYGTSKPNILYRFDWRLPMKDALDSTKLDNLKGDDITAIVIEDHGKGVIDEPIISKLIDIVQNKPNVNWYIRSKIDNPTWLSLLKQNGITPRLLVINQQLAEYWHGQRRWRFGNKLARASLEMLGDLKGEYIFKHGEHDIERRNKLHYNSLRAAIIFDDNTAIAIDEEMNCYNLYNPPGPKQLINIGRTSMFFSALIAQDLSEHYKNNSFGVHCNNALKVAFDWSKEASTAWNKQNLYFYGDYKTALQYLENDGGKTENIESCHYNDLWKSWNDSSKGDGILRDKNISDKFQMWRGKGTLEDYICVGGPKRDTINDLINKVQQFNNQKDLKHSFNCLLISSPGWGKSFLAKCLAKYCDMHYLAFSLSQMANTNDLIDCFDTICAAQNMAENRFIIFMDEINCEIEGHEAMSLLLSPIWDGSFIRGGKRYQLKPSIWVFASTQPIRDLVKSVKGSDFISRLNGPVIELDRLATDNPRHGEMVPIHLSNLRKKLGENPDIDIYTDSDYITFRSFEGVFKTDQIYLGISLLNNLWGPISRIQQEVIDLFKDIVLINGIRSLEFFVSKFQFIQDGKIVSSNVPSIDKLLELKRHVILPKQWTTAERPKDEKLEHKFIDIEIDPSFM